MKTIKISGIAIVLSLLLNFNAKANADRNLPRKHESKKGKVTGIKNIVLVHGAFVDGSGWKPVYEILTKAGYTVTIVQEPLTSFANDLAAITSVLDRRNGPCILVGHSYAGSLITEAGNGKLYPSAYKSLKKTAEGFDYIEPSSFYADFAAGLPKKQAEFMAHSQVLPADEVFHYVIQNPAWKVKPSWYMVAKSDRIINPDLERMYAKRAGSYKVEIEGASHSVFESHPKDVVKLIIKAATSAPHSH